MTSRFEQKLGEILGQATPAFNVELVHSAFRDDMILTFDVPEGSAPDAPRSKLGIDISALTPEHDVDRIQRVAGTIRAAYTHGYRDAGKDNKALSEGIVKIGEVIANDALSNTAKLAQIETILKDAR